MNNFVDDDNNIETLVTTDSKSINTAMYENSENHNIKVVKPVETHDMYQSPMRESTDSSDNLLSIVSSDEQSPKNINYQVKNSCRNTNANDIFEPENHGHFRKPEWLETLTVKEIDTKQHKETIDNYAKQSSQNKKFGSANDNKLNANNYTDPYYYYVDKENYYNNSYRNSSVNSSLSSTPVHKRYTRQRSCNSPEPNPGIRTIDQIFNKSLNVSKKHASPMDNVEAMSTDSSYSCHLDKTESPSQTAGYIANTNSPSGVEIVELDCNDRNVSDSEFPLKSGIIKTINSAIYDDKDYIDNTNFISLEDAAAQATIKADRERLQKCFSSKPRSIRIGYARRVPPKDDPQHIPLKAPNYSKIDVLGNIKDNSCQNVDIVPTDVTLQTIDNSAAGIKQQHLLPPMQVLSNQTQHSYINGRGDPEIGTPV